MSVEATLGAFGAGIVAAEVWRVASEAWGVRTAFRGWRKRRMDGRTLDYGALNYAPSPELVATVKLSMDNDRRVASGTSASGQDVREGCSVIANMALLAARNDFIRKLRGKNCRMREALTDIRNRILCPVGPQPTLEEIQEIASAALGDGA